MNRELDTASHNQQLILQEIATLPQISEHQKRVFFKKGDDPLNSADTSNYFYFILHGKIKIYQIDFTTSKEQILYLLSRGDMFDVTALLDNNRENIYISEVLEDIELIQVPLADVQKMILTDKNFRQFFYSYLAAQLRSIEDLAISLSFYDVLQRVIQLFTKFTHTTNNKAELKIIDNLKHEDIAAMVGSVRKVVNRSLQKLKKDDIIELSRKKIHIKNFQKLLDKLSV